MTKTTNKNELIFIEQGDYVTDDNNDIYIMKKFGEEQFDLVSIKDAKEITTIDYHWNSKTLSELKKEMNAVPDNLIANSKLDVSSLKKVDIEFNYHKLNNNVDFRVGNTFVLTLDDEEELFISAPNEIGINLKTGNYIELPIDTDTFYNVDVDVKIKNMK